VEIVDLRQPAPAPSSTPTIGEGGVITGRFLAVGGPVGAQPTPERGRIVLRQRGRIVMTVRVPEDGRYRFGILPGTYSLVGYTPQFQGADGDAPCPSDPPTVRVHFARTTHINIYCQRN
jgi:hypothetical protein